MKALTRPILRRLAWLDEQLRHDGYPNSTIACAALEITERTFYRDIDCLKHDYDAPIAFDHQRNGYYYTEPNYLLPAVRLREGELVAVFVAEKVLAQYRGTPYEEQLTGAFRKITDLLPDQVSVHLDHFNTAVSFALGPARPPVLGWFEVFARAVEKRRRVWMRYHTQSRDEETEREVDPYHLRNHQGDWYLIAFDHLRGEMRDFLLSRVRAAQLTGGRFRIPDDFSLDSYLRQSFGVERGAEPTTVRIRFDAYQARWIRERVWHPTQEIEEHPDGGLTLTFTVTGLEEVKRWVLQYGAHAEVLAPASLRDAVAEEAGKMVRSYSAPRP